MYRVHWLRICCSGRKNKRADPRTEEAPRWHAAGGCTRLLSWGRDFLCEIENLWWWTNYASHQQGSLTLLLLADITYVFCGGVACRKMLPTIINLVHAAFWEEAEALLRRSWPSSCWATFVFEQWGQQKKGNFGPVCLSYPATESVQLTTRVNTTTIFPTSVMGCFSLKWCSNARTHQVPSQ